MLQRANHCRRKRKKERRRRKMKTMRRRMKSRRSYSVTSIPFHSGWRRRKSMVMALQQQNLQLELKAANTRLETTPLPPPRLPTKHWAPSIPANRKVYHHQSLPLVSHNALCLLQPCWPTAECVSQLIWDVIWIQWGQRGGEGRREGQKRAEDRRKEREWGWEGTRGEEVRRRGEERK